MNGSIPARFTAARRRACARRHTASGGSLAWILTRAFLCRTQSPTEPRSAEEDGDAEQDQDRHDRHHEEDRHVREGLEAGGERPNAGEEPVSRPPALRDHRLRGLAGTERQLDRRETGELIDAAHLELDLLD